MLNNVEESILIKNGKTMHHICEQVTIIPIIIQNINGVSRKWPINAKDRLKSNTCGNYLEDTFVSAAQKVPLFYNFLVDRTNIFDESIYIYNIPCILHTLL